jgi:DNA replication and repair protein RecF
MSFSSHVNVFVGENGQGKTNLLEALYLVTQGESFRYSNNSTIIQKNCEQSIIQSYLTQDDLEYKIQIGVAKTKKLQTLNGKKISSADTKKIFPCVVFSPESLSSIKEGAEHRRLLIDDLLITFDKKNSSLLADYRKILKTRNKVLKNNVQGVCDLPTTLNLLDSLKAEFVRLATELTTARTHALRGLLNEFNSAMQYISSNSDVDISVEYLVSERNLLTATKAEFKFYIEKRMNELYDAELTIGASLVGPHKHDIVFLYNQNDSRFFCSQGQQRAIILSFKIAQIVYHRKTYGTYPVLMLDDVLSELDNSKKNALISFLHEINTQIFITTTDFSLPNIFSLEQLSVVRIKDGSILD